MQERTNPELDVATMVMLLDCGMSLKDIAECFKLEVKTVERLIVEDQRSRTSRRLFREFRNCAILDRRDFRAAISYRNEALKCCAGANRSFCCGGLEF
jgi:hypothetical protein